VLGLIEAGRKVTNMAVDDHRAPDDQEKRSGDSVHLGDQQEAENRDDQARTCPPVKT
jgi:hypothetical protein